MPNKCIIIVANQGDETMTVITLPEDIEDRIAEQARKQGTTPERLAIESLRGLFSPPVERDESHTDRTTLFDLLSGYVGTISGSTEAWSENAGARFLAGLEERQQQGNM